MDATPDFSTGCRRKSQRRLGHALLGGIWRISYDQGTQGQL
jgi:hypothetical protein